jgi:RNA polymerase sigma-70 factor (ECF subfamily)
MNQDEFIEIIKKHQKIIYKICFSFCRFSEDQEDLEQEIMIQIWHSLKQFDGRVKLSTWIYRVSLNTAISFYRKEKKRRLNKSKLNESAFYLENQTEVSVAEEVKLTELKKAINSLNDLEKSLILLYLDDLKYSEISKIMGISESNVGTKLNRIKIKLKSKING